MYIDPSVNYYKKYMYAHCFHHGNLKRNSSAVNQWKYSANKKVIHASCKKQCIFQRHLNDLQSPVFLNDFILLIIIIQTVNYWMTYEARRIGCRWRTIFRILRGFFAS